MLRHVKVHIGSPDGLFGDLTHLGANPKICLQVESQLATAYCDSKAQQLDVLLQDMLADEGGGWARAPFPTGVRDCTMELLFALVSFVVLRAGATVLRLYVLLGDCYIRSLMYS